MATENTARRRRPAAAPAAAEEPPKGRRRAAAAAAPAAAEEPPKGRRRAAAAPAAAPAPAKSRKAPAADEGDDRVWPRFKKLNYAPYGEKQNIGNLAKELILAGKTTDEVVEAVQDVDSTSRISPSHIAYYRQALRKEGYDLGE